MREMARDMGQIVDDMDDIEDEYVEDLIDEAENDSDVPYDSDGASPSRESPA